MTSGTDPVIKFHEVYKLYYSHIFASVYRKVSSFEESEEICQDIFMALFDSIQQVENPRAWLYGTMRKKIADFYSRKGRSAEEISGILEESSAVYINGFRDTRIIIEEVLSGEGVFDDEADREIFNLIAVDGFSMAETARNTGRTYRQIRYSFERSASRIIDALKKRGIAQMEDLL